MKKLISALLASAMCLTVVPFSVYATEAEVYHIDKDAVNAKLELMKNGEYPLDFNGDGKINYFDAVTIANYYGEVQTHCIDLDGNEIGDAKSKLDAETRQRVHDYGNLLTYIDADNYVDIFDAQFLLTFIQDNGYIDYGDVNYDGVVDALDASFVLECYAFKQAPYSTGLDNSDIDLQEIYPSVKFAGDVNDDGVLDALDASEILAQYSAAQVNN